MDRQDCRSLLAGSWHRPQPFLCPQLFDDLRYGLVLTVHLVIEDLHLLFGQQTAELAEHMHATCRVAG